MTIEQRGQNGITGDPSLITDRRRDLPSRADLILKQCENMVDGIWRDWSPEIRHPFVTQAYTDARHQAVETMLTSLTIPQAAQHLDIQPATVHMRLQYLYGALGYPLISEEPSFPNRLVCSALEGIRANVLGVDLREHLHEFLITLTTPKLSGTQLKVLEEMTKHKDLLLAAEGIGMTRSTFHVHLHRIVSKYKLTGEKPFPYITSAGRVVEEAITRGDLASTPGIQRFLASCIFPPKELEIMSLLNLGRTMQEIATHLNIKGRTTVGVLLKRARTRVDTQTNLELLRIVARLGLNETSAESLVTQTQGYISLKEIAKITGTQEQSIRYHLKTKQIPIIEITKYERYIDPRILAQHGLLPPDHPLLAPERFVVEWDKKSD